MPYKQRLSASIYVHEDKPCPEDKEEEILPHKERTVKLSIEEKPRDRGHRHRRGNRKIIHIAKCKSVRVKIGDPEPHKDAKIGMKETDGQ
jgi:hypothetical protein